MTMGSLTFAQKMVLGMFGILLSGAVLSGAMYRALNATQASLDQLTGSSVPAASAAYEMEINVAETGLKALKYLDLREPRFRTGALEDMSEFESFLQRYTQLARDPNSIALGEKARALFAEFRSLSLGLMDDEDARHALTTQIATTLQQLDNVIDQELRPAISPASARAAKCTLPP